MPKKCAFSIDRFLRHYYCNSVAVQSITKHVLYAGHGIAPCIHATARLYRYVHMRGFLCVKREVSFMYIYDLQRIKYVEIKLVDLSVFAIQHYFVTVSALD